MKAFIITIVVVAVIAVGLIYFLGDGFGMLVSSSPTQTPSANTVNNSSGNQVSGVLGDALRGEGGAKCNFSDDQGNTGSIYVMGDNTLVNVVNTDQTKQINILFRGDKVYMWENGQPNGLEFNASELTGNNPTEPQTREQFINKVNNISNACQSYTISSTQFSVPQNVNFQMISPTQQ